MAEAPTTPITVLIADDENLLRGAIAALLDLQPNIHVVAQADNGSRAVELAAVHDPDVVLLDLEMPGLDGIDAATAILARRPSQAIILLTRHGRAG
jgi:two-component system response regulator DesR